ncbi:DUF4411 family protein [Acinetobacter stercoris]|uniref:DUF4411 family protein n=1 Tax=Acinetobacter stercoris TaxID=2126983 RepID=A0A2U3MV59_9GAMM|nr:DUF4411 family protein [Acinetobacter stercoris]SPL69318.1 hypothetical protein KPC_0496 [Acinetobacter stercoris]
MIKISLDTNAVLDLCYRTYPEQIFLEIWSSLEACKSANQIKFYMCEAVLHEIEQKITDYEYDESVFIAFLDRFCVHQINPNEHGSSILTLKQELLKYEASRSSQHVMKDNYADLDVISLAYHYGVDTCVITCEQRTPFFNWENKSHTRNMKIPNICEKLNIECGNWSDLFLKLGFVF